MDERDLEPEEPAARLPVDQLGADGGELTERGPDVRDLVRDVVHSLAAPREKPSDRRVLAERGEQLDAAGADEHGDRLDTLLLEEAAVLELGVEQPRVGRERLVEVVHGDAEMMDAAGDHAPRCYLLARGTRAYRDWSTPTIAASRSDSRSPTLATRGCRSHSSRTGSPSTP